MRVVLQRVSSASVTIGGRVTGAIGSGLLVLAGFEAADASTDGEWMARKICNLRIFADEAASPEQSRGGHMDKSVVEVGGGILLISQFTLHASLQKGARPSFNAAAPPAHARPLYEKFAAQLSAALGRPVATGEFGAYMDVALVNDGPVTLMIDSKQRE